MATSSHRQVIWTPLKTTQGDKRRQRRRIAVIAVPVALIALIALAVRGGSGTGQTPAFADQAVAAPQMTHTKEGAETTALKIAMDFGSERMFVPAQRRKVLQSIFEPDKLAEMNREYDAQYDPFAKRLGLDEDGNPPPGAQFVSRAAPVGMTVRTYTGSTATVDYWCTTLFGLTGTHSDKEVPLKTGWLTARVSLNWTAFGWRLTDYKQTDGPQPADGQFGTAPQL